MKAAGGCQPHQGHPPTAIYRMLGTADYRDAACRCATELHACADDRAVRYAVALLLRLQYFYSTNEMLSVITSVTKKTTTLTFRLDLDLKEALRTAAEREHRSIANMIEVLIREHCARQGIPIGESPPPPGGDSMEGRRP